MAKSTNVFFNPNPTKSTKVGDCVVRAMCKATGNDWDTVFKRLCNLAYKYKQMPNSDEIWQKYITENGFEYVSIPVKKGSKRPTVDSFCKENKKGTYVLRVANHVVTVADGRSWDTWDCSDKSVYGYWNKKDLQE
jgi:hypothetical protein